jgi:hypothetical protein
MRAAALLAVLVLLAPPTADAAPDSGKPPAPPSGKPTPPAAEAVDVTFQLNDAMVKDKVLAGVRVGAKRPGDAQYLAAGESGADGKIKLSLPPGRYLVTYLKDGYVPVRDSAVQVTRAGQQITTTLSMMLEAAGQGGKRRVQIVLNWGSEDSQVKDADAHLCRLDLKPLVHVFWQRKLHPNAKVSVELDVDDTNGGGPETVTLLDPPLGEYTYWVHNFSGEPATLGSSAVKVRVLFGDSVAGEFPVPEGLNSRHWRPFKALKIDAMLEPSLVPFSKEELAAGLDRAEVQVPAEPERDFSSGSTEDGCLGTGLQLEDLAGLGVALFVFLIWIVRKVRKG